MKKSDIWILMPAYNEGKNIGRVIKGLQDQKYRNIIVVDDCSTDATLNITKELGVTALHHRVNRGQGAALRTGTEYFLNETKGKYLVHFDSDGQHRVEEIALMVKPIADDIVDMTTGSRFLHKKGVQNIPLTKRAILKVGILVNRILFDIKATDAHNGFRALNRKAAQAINFKEPRMEHASEIAALIPKRSIRHKEIPVVIDYNEYGQNIIHGVKMGLNLLKKRYR